MFRSVVRVSSAESQEWRQNQGNIIRGIHGLCPVRAWAIPENSGVANPNSFMPRARVRESLGMIPHKLLKQSPTFGVLLYNDVVIQLGQTL